MLLYDVHIYPSYSLGGAATPELHPSDVPAGSKAGTVQKKKSSVESNREAVIDVDDVSDGSSDVQEITQVPVTALRDKVNKHRSEASSIRLSTKKDPSSGSITAGEYLKRSKAAHNIAVDPKKNAPIQFRCELMLHSGTGRKIGTRVPSQSRTFNVTEVSAILSLNVALMTNYPPQDVDSVLDRVLAMFNEDGGQWMKLSNGIALSR